MLLRRLSNLALSVLLLGASAPQHLIPIVFEAPAGGRPVAPLPDGAPYAQILPSGRLVVPVGESAAVGKRALGVALTPDGSYAIVSSAGDTNSVGSMLTVIDTRTMRTTEWYRPAGESFFTGVAALSHPQNPARTLVLASGGASNDVYALDLDATGHLTPDARPRIAMPVPQDPSFADEGHAFPATILLSRDATRAYVANEVGGTVGVIDTKTRSLVGVSPRTGFFPASMGISGDRLLVANEGLMRYGRLPVPQTAPRFASAPPDLMHASSLALLTLTQDGALNGSIAQLPMDQAPDGVSHVGGAHPSALATSPDGAYAYVAMTNVDRIATVALGVTPTVVGGTELRLYVRGPFGTQPDALAVSRDGKRLYVALAGLNAVAVLDASDPHHLHRVGLLPTGWFPSALALSPDDRFLYVVNAKGMETADALGTLQRIDLRTVDLRRTTRAALSYQHVTRLMIPNSVVPQGFTARGSAKIKHVVSIVTGAQSGGGPNWEALAREFAVAADFYVEAEEPAAGQQFAFGGMADAYTEKTERNQDPEDYPRSGYLFDSLAAAHKSYRNYGNLLSLSGFDPAARAYRFDVPALAALADRTDLSYPACSSDTPDLTRVQEFMHDFGTTFPGATMPAFTAICLGDRAPDEDAALGRLVEYLTHLPEWRDTAIFIAPVAAHAGTDRYRASAIVVSPYARRSYTSQRHFSTESILKTEDELLGVQSLSLGDTLATDMRDLFTKKTNPTPFTAKEKSLP